jgi:1-acyl-sn-glycerol-3-phosphate acyltransferase
MKGRTIAVFVFYIIAVLCLTPVVCLFILFGIRDPLIAIGRFAIRVSQGILGLELDVAGWENAAAPGPLIFMPNHQSFIDGPLMMMILRRPVRVILKREVFRLPVVGLGMRHVEFVPVDRRGTRGGRASIDRAARLIKEKGYSFLIFPEGTRSLDGALQKFRRGGFYLALESGASIVPVAIKGTFELMPKGSFFVKKGRVGVVFLPPVSVADYRPDRLGDLIGRVRAAIEQELARRA